MKRGINFFGFKSMLFIFSLGLIVSFLVMFVPLLFGGMFVDIGELLIISVALPIAFILIIICFGSKGEIIMVDQGDAILCTVKSLNLIFNRKTKRILLPKGSEFKLQQYASGKYKDVYILESEVETIEWKTERMAIGTQKQIFELFQQYSSTGEPINFIRNSICVYTCATDIKQEPLKDYQLRRTMLLVFKCSLVGILALTIGVSSWQKHQEQIYYQKLEQGIDEVTSYLDNNGQSELADLLI